MADKQITVAVPEERVPEFYVWFASFLAAEAGGPPRRGRPGGRGGPDFGGPDFGGPGRHFADPVGWSAADAEESAWLYRKLAEPARALFDLLIDAPGEPVAGNEIAARLGLEKGAHGVAGILAWPGRYSRKLGRELPIATQGRADGGTDYYMDPAIAEIFAAARTRG
ncbi:MAG TPA: DUF6416 domain-containing protein [Solirubrobacteraceae bacterium]|jgi:hypothetical protein|nr:DUF6416 domain-containing protein [Solirubrobacteraceae bacterium]